MASADVGTVKMHDLKSNSRIQMDLLVMENLFYKQSVAQTYDLKGIGEGESLCSWS
jgi:hypothetical protein